MTWCIVNIIQLFAVTVYNLCNSYCCIFHFLYSKRPDRLWGPPSLLFKWTPRILSPE